MTDFIEEGLDDLWRNAQRSLVKGAPRFRHYREWAIVCAAMEKRLGPGEFRALLGAATIESVAGDTVTIALPSRMLRDWCNSRYGSIMLADWKAQNRKIRSLAFKVVPVPPHAANPARGTCKNPPIGQRSGRSSKD